MSEFETRAYALIGKLVVVYSRLDVNLALYVAGRKGPQAWSDEIIRLENTSFRDKLAVVIEAATRERGAHPQCVADWTEWLSKADRLRRRRNDLVHGRWAVQESQSRVCHAVGLPGSLNQVAARFTLEELAAEVSEAESVAYRFGELSSKWPA